MANMFRMIVRATLVPLMYEFLRTIVFSQLLAPHYVVDGVPTVTRRSLVAFETHTLSVSLLAAVDGGRTVE
eukprot:scaffold386_cov107-Skeletonema_dohrnii-CCMP3373.AAC.12